MTVPWAGSLALLNVEPGCTPTSFPVTLLLNGVLAMVLPVSLTASGRTPMLTVAVSQMAWLGLGRQSE